MEGFKNRLNRELQQDAPFTNAIKQRLLQPKQMKRKKNWQVVIVSVAVCFILGFTLFTTFYQGDNLQVANQPSAPLPIVDDVSNSDVIEPKYADILGEQWMLRGLPMLIDTDAPLTYGDYIAFYGKDGLVVSTVVGLENNQVAMKQGQILVNNQPLKVHGLNKQINRKNRNDINNPYLFYNQGEQSKPFIDKTIATTGKELVVYTNEPGHTIMKIPKGQLAGKVVGFQNFTLTFTLTQQEQQAFDAFKMDYNLERLKNMTPLAITKMFLLSDIEKDYATYEALFTTTVNEETEIIRTHYKKTKNVRQNLFTEEINRIVIAQNFSGIENGEFVPQSNTFGTIKFTSIKGTQTELSMEKNEQGIWQPAFSRGIY